jgi:hypothetical protein
MSGQLQDSNDDNRIREFALRTPAFRILANTPAPQGSTGITTNVFPAMTLGYGAVAGNSTSDNIGPLHLINIKRLAFMTRQAEDAFEKTDMLAANATPNRDAIVAAVERYLAKRRFETKRNEPKAPVAPPDPMPKAPPAEIVDFVCESDVRAAMSQSRKIHIRPATIVTPSARDLSLYNDVLVMTDQKKVLKKAASE